MRLVAWQAADLLRHLDAAISVYGQAMGYPPRPAGDPQGLRRRARAPARLPRRRHPRRRRRAARASATATARRPASGGTTRWPARCAATSAAGGSRLLRAGRAARAPRRAGPRPRRPAAGRAAHRRPAAARWCCPRRRPTSRGRGPGGCTAASSSPTCCATSTSRATTARSPCSAGSCRSATRLRDGAPGLLAALVAGPDRLSAGRRGRAGRVRRGHCRARVRCSASATPRPRAVRAPPRPSSRSRPAAGSRSRRSGVATCVPFGCYAYGAALGPRRARRVAG